MKECHRAAVGAGARRLVDEAHARRATALERSGEVAHGVIPSRSSEAPQYAQRSAGASSGSTTDSTAAYPTSKPYTPGCVLSTMYHVLGIDHKHVFYDDAQRPMPILAEGEPIKELMG